MTDTTPMTPPDIARPNAGRRPEDPAAFPAKLPVRELMDMPWWPHAFRDAHTRYLSWIFSRFGLPDRLLDQMAARGLIAEGRAGELRIVDLCGGQTGGIWPELLTFAATRFPGTRITVVSTDLFPDARTPARDYPNGSRLIFDPVPRRPEEAIEAHEADLYSVVNGFHHLDTAEKEGLLSAVAEGEGGLLILETVEPTPGCAVSVLPAIPASVVFALTHPRSLTRTQLLLWTVLPILPFLIVIDSLLSCYRTYRPQRMTEIVRARMPGRAVETAIDRRSPVRLFATFATREARG